MSSTPHPDLRNDPAPATATLKALDLAHHLHPFTDHGELRQDGGARVIASAQGCHLTDTDGQRLLDGMGGLWCVNIGYGRRELAEVAARQMNELPYYNSFFKTTMPETVLLAEELAALTRTIPISGSRAATGRSAASPSAPSSSAASSPITAAPSPRPA